MKRQMFLITFAITLLLIGFVAGQFALKHSIAQQIRVIEGLYNPMDEMVLTQTGDLGITISLVDRVLEGDLKEFYRLSCLRVSLTLDSLENTPPEYAQKFHAPEAVVESKAMLAKLQARGYCIPNPAFKRDALKRAP